MCHPCNYPILKEIMDGPNQHVPLNLNDLKPKGFHISYVGTPIQSCWSSSTNGGR
jgi:hypothetical protein